MKKASMIGFLVVLLALSGASCIPRDPHPERTPSPRPSIIL